MAKYEVGDLVVLKSGSMRMLVEEVGDDDTVSTVWCNEGVIGRDRFSAALLNKWEHREDGGAGRGAPRGGDREGGYKGRGGGDRDGGGYRGKGGDDRGGGKGRGGDRDDDRSDRPPRKTGWDGKPREKKYFRKDG